MAGDSSLWPVVVGGAIALGGVAITNVINFLMKRGESQEARKKARAAKFEELVETVYAFDHWLRTKRDVTAYGEKKELGTSPLAKIEAIVGSVASGLRVMIMFIVVALCSACVSHDGQNATD